MRFRFLKQFVEARPLTSFVKPSAWLSPLSSEEHRHVLDRASEGTTLCVFLFGYGICKARAYGREGDMSALLWGAKIF